jgi:alkylation response protein AidB-like acyl-CoA dehydrogenase
VDLDLSEEQQVLREMVRGLLAEHCSIDVVRALEDDAVGHRPELWSRLAELGIVGMRLPEAWGGGGQSLLDAVVVYEELGRSLAPTPHFPSAVMAGAAILAGGSVAQRSYWLPGIASGDSIVVPAWLEPGGSDRPRGVRLRATREGDEFRLEGVKRHVGFAVAADHFLVLARTGPEEGEVDLFLVETGSPGLTLHQQRAMASDAQFRVEFSGVRVPAANRIGGAGSGWAIWERAMLEGIVLLAAQAMGGAARSLELTVDYAKQREQFDKPIGAFQAISHYLADASTKIAGGTHLVYEAAWTHGAGRPIDRLAPMAKLFACETYRDTTAMCQQVWGGVGFTVDYDIQLYFRRAKQLELSWWGTRTLEERIADTALDPV